MANDSRFFTLITTVETVSGEVTCTPQVFTKAQENAAICAWHHECEYNRSSNDVAYFSSYIINEFGGKEVGDSYRKQEVAPASTPAPSAE